MSNNQSEDLKELFYSFTVLYESWNKDSLALTKQALKIEQLTKDFTVRVNEFSTVKEDTKKDIAQSIQTGIYSASKALNDKVQETIKQEMAQAIQGINSAAQKSIEAIKKYDSYTTRTSTITNAVTWIVAIAAGAAAGMLIALWIMPTPRLPLTNEQFITYQHGKHFEDFWYKLSPAEQKRLNDIALDKQLTSKTKKNKRNDVDSDQ